MSAVLIRLPNSHRGNDRVRNILGYEPHIYRSYRQEGYFTYLSEEDAQKLLVAKRATKTRVKPEDLHGVWYQPDTFRGTPPKDETCQHTRIIEIPIKGKVCCECGRKAGI